MWHRVWSPAYITAVYCGFSSWPVLWWYEFRRMLARVLFAGRRELVRGGPGRTGETQASLRRQVNTCARFSDHPPCAIATTSDATRSSLGPGTLDALGLMDRWTEKWIGGTWIRLTNDLARQEHLIPLFLPRATFNRIRIRLLSVTCIIVRLAGRSLWFTADLVNFHQVG